MAFPSQINLLPWAKDVAKPATRKFHIRFQKKGEERNSELFAFPFQKLAILLFIRRFDDVFALSLVDGDLTVVWMARFHLDVLSTRKSNEFRTLSRKERTALGKG